MPDPYRWLEDTDDPEVQAWTDAQNALTRSILDSLPFREQVREEIRAAWNYSTYSSPRIHGNRYFFRHNDGQQNHEVLYMLEGLDEKPVVVVDPNSFSEDGTTAMDYWYVSNTGRYIAYGISERGTENSVLHIYDVDAGRELPYTIDRCRYSSVAWLESDDAFFYTRRPKEGEVPRGEENYHEKVFLHRLGSDPADDPLIFAYPDHPDYGIGVMISENYQYLIFVVYRGSAAGQMLYISDVDHPTKIVPVAVDVQADFRPFTTDSLLFVLTNEGAPFYRLMCTELSRPQREHWREVIAERGMLLEGAQVVNRMLVLNYLKNASSLVEIYDLDGNLLRSLELPMLGEVSDVQGRWNGSELFFKFQSMAYPPEIVLYNLDRFTRSTFRKSDFAVLPEDYVIKQVWYNSRDGTPVSMFIAHKQGIKLNGRNPTLLYGYGGFQVNMTPYFSSTRVVWMNRGGVFAMPNLRGGNEYGEAWHRAGMLDKKQNTFDDFVAAARYLVDSNYTSPERLAVWGGSNGGLLIGAVVTQRPHLFKAAICSVPLIDMIRYHKFLIARYWVPEYGSSDDPVQLPFLLAYSPYHNVQPGVKYPAMYIDAGENDMRVHPLHARKMAAMMQNHNGGSNPILLWVERKTGHGQGMPRSLQLDYATDKYSFLMWQLEM